MESFESYLIENGKRDCIKYIHDKREEKRVFMGLFEKKCGSSQDQETKEQLHGKIDLFLCEHFKGDLSLFSFKSYLEKIGEDILSQYVKDRETEVRKQNIQQALSPPSFPSNLSFDKEGNERGH